ncbi:MAG: acyltransferase family protein [Candidatus Woesearchaeota archaeon]
MKKSRLKSLDFFRGFAISAMILVNFIGSNSYNQLNHADWHGFTFADTIFPFFLWIIGVSIIFSFTKKLEKGFNKKEILLLIIKRSFILFIIGIFLNLLPYFDFASFRIMGVLQRIALTYLFAGIIVLYFKPRWQLITTIFILLFYWLLIIFAPGNLEMDNNFPGYIDQLILGNRMYNEHFDPEGLLSTLPAITTILFGAFAGQIIINKKLKEKIKIKKLFYIGFLLLIIGLIWNIFFPINKNLWTSSFSVFMSGLAFILFAIIYYLIDIKKYKLGFAFIVFGMNAITLYVTASLINKFVNLNIFNGSSLNYIIYNNLLFLSSKNAYLFIGLFYIFIIYLIAYFMYKKEWFLKV